MKRRFKPASFFTYMILILLASTFILPLIWMLRSSLMGMKQIFRLPPEWIPNPFVWSNYSDALQRLDFAQCFKNTIIVVILGVSGTVITSACSAYAWARIDWKGRNLWFALSMSSMMLPGAVTLIPVFLGYRNAGMYDTLFPLFLAAWFGGGASNQFLLRQFLMGIPKALDEAAYIDGAGYFRIFISIVLPLCKSALVVVGMFSFLFYWNDFFSPMIYLENYKNYTIALGLQSFVSQYSSQWMLLMAAATIGVLPAIVVFLIGQKYLLEGIALTGIKG